MQYFSKSSVSPQERVGRLMRQGLLAMLVGVVPLFNSAFAQPKNESLPELSEIQDVVKKHFESLDGFEEGDLVSQRDVVGLFKKLETLGWTVADEKKILEQVLPDNDYMVTQLRTKNGKKFARKLSKTAQAFDRLDRLRRMPHGKRRIREFIKGPDGHLMIIYMASTRGGRNMGKFLSRAKNGKNFNKPTGRLYTSKDVLSRLEKSYKAASDPGEKK